MRSRLFYPVMRTWGEKAKFAFKPKSHIELCENLKLVDFARALYLAARGEPLIEAFGAEFATELAPVAHQF